MSDVDVFSLLAPYPALGRDYQLIKEAHDMTITIAARDTPPYQDQVGGEHYRSLAIGPMEFCLRNRLGPATYAVLKYLIRFSSTGSRGGNVEDLDKAIHCIEMYKFEEQHGGTEGQHGSGQEVQEAEEGGGPEGDPRHIRIP